MTTPSSLTQTGTAILLVYGAKLHPPRNGRPGVRCTIDGRGAVLIELVGYACPTSRGLALADARRTCEDAGLEVQVVTGSRTTAGPALIVRKRP